MVNLSFCLSLILFFPLWSCDRLGDPMCQIAVLVTAPLKIFLCSLSYQVITGPDLSVNLYKSFFSFLSSPPLSIQLMEYRDSTSSPSQCSVSTSTSALDSDRLDRLNSPPSPSSPPGPMDDQRLPNELLDEICEDIGMKEGMELDFVELLMEQDTNPQMYMTPEAISSSGAFNR